MYSVLGIGCAVAALLGSGAAMPAPDATPVARLPARDAILKPRADPTAPWVTVDDNGRPVTTYTPSVTTVSGTVSAQNGAPHDLTATVYTWTSWGDITTSTGRPPNPTATSKNNDGAFSRCFNTDGDFAPFCTPYNNSTLLTGNTYYITWDPDYYKALHAVNTTWEITVRLDYLNKTSNQWIKLQSFDQDRVPASWGFWPFKVTGDYLKGERTNNVTITLLAGPQNSKDTNSSIALPIAIENPGFPQNKPTPVPKGHTLTIALPVVLGTVAIMVFGVCLWNRKTRRIQLGNLIPRPSRKGYSGRQLRRKFFQNKVDDSIQLHGADAHIPGGGYHDTPDAPQREAAPRRDSVALESLADEVDDLFVNQTAAYSGHRNAFRDEVQRQDQERRGL